MVLSLLLSFRMTEFHRYAGNMTWLDPLSFVYSLTLSILIFENGLTFAVTSCSQKKHTTVLIVRFLYFLLVPGPEPRQASKYLI